MNVKAKVAMLAVATLLTAGCSTTAVNVNYAPTVSIKQAAAPVASVGKFSDQRNESPTYLGAVRGGFGNPLKKVESSKPVANLVADAFTEGLKARGLLKDGGDAPFRINGQVKTLETNRYVRIESNCTITVTVSDRNNNQVYIKTYDAKVLEGSLVAMDTGVFANVDELRAAAAKALSQVVDKALDDPELRVALAATGQ